MKRLPDAERRRLLPPDDGGVRESLSLEELRELVRDADIGAHTRTHPVLPSCDDATAAEEITGSKADLEAMLDRPCELFAYPNGDFCERDVRGVRDAGFRFAVTTRAGLVAPGADPLRLPRVLLHDDAAAWEAVACASGLPGHLRSLERMLQRRA
jgi:peptidoglycan/xylan/chitin deacetylase (PgdA/CDA1 family)